MNLLAEHKYLDVIINGIPDSLQVDTASDIIIVSEDTSSKIEKPKMHVVNNMK